MTDKPNPNPDQGRQKQIMMTRKHGKSKDPVAELVAAAREGSKALHALLESGSELSVSKCIEKCLALDAALEPFTERDDD